MLASLEGLDHVVVMVRDLDAAAERWRALGFTLSPRGTHSAHMGTGNYTVMLRHDYIELLGVVRETEVNAAGRRFLERRGEGLDRAAFTTSDAATGVAALHAAGIQATGPLGFSRPVDLPDGTHGEAAFSIFNWPRDERPADLEIFACQHRTRATVWIPSLQSHANTATAIARIELVTPAPDQAAAHLARLIDASPEQAHDGVRVATAPGRGEFLFLSHEAFRGRHPSVRADELPREGAAALVLRVADLDAAARAAGADASADAGSVTVPARHANGVVLVFQPG